MDSDRNPFRELTQDEKDKREAKRLAVEKARKEAEALASQCINNKLFVKYKEKYERLEKLTISELIDYNDPELTRYAFNTRRMLDELRQLRLLLRGVEADAREKKANK